MIISHFCSYQQLLSSTLTQVSLPDDDPARFLPQIWSDFIVVLIILIICQTQTLERFSMFNQH